LEELPRRHAQGLSEAMNVVERHVSLGALDRANICPMQTARVGERLLA